ncbi:MAG: hypothetical protein ACREMY_02340 [bacterium]
MAVWDFSQEGTRERMQQRAAHDAFYAVNHYWPHERIEPLPGMPQDIELWARKMAQRFMSGTLVFPAWALVTEETANRTYFQVLYDYFNVCYY